MVKAIRMQQYGGPEVMEFIDVDLPDPGPGEVRLTHKAISVHFADIMIRQGVYFLKPDMPAPLGLEGVGVVEALGDGVDNVQVGDRVAYSFNLGSYSQARNIIAAPLIKVPDGVKDVEAAACMLRGMTAQYLLRQTYPVKAGDTLLVHAAAGGMGQLLTQWGKHLGAQVIGTVSTAAKAEMAKKNGCDHVINYSTEDFAKRVAEITDNKGVQVVYDSVGKDIYDSNVSCLATLGYFVNYGNSSGPLLPIDPAELNAKSLFFTKASLRDYAAQPNGVANMSSEAFGLIEQGVLKVTPQTYALEDVAQAHIDMAARNTTGQVVLLP